MKVSVKTGAICAAIWILAKLTMFYAGMNDSLVPGIMLNTFLMLAAIAIGLYLTKVKQDDSNTLTDIKDAMSASLPYTVILSAFMYMYYDGIDTEFLEHRNSERMTAIEKSIEGEQWDIFRKENPNFETMSREEYLTQQQENTDLFLSPKSVALMNLLGGLVLGTFYSIFVAIIYRRVVFR